MSEERANNSAKDHGVRATSSAPKFQHHDLHDTVVAERFEVTGLIGLGGMGAVWQAFDRKLERTVAIKVLPRTLTRHPQYRERFLREAQAAAKLREHPHIVPVYHCGIDRERESLYLAMRLVRGTSLRERVKQHGPFAEPQALVLMREVLSALGFAHEHGIVHRDVKPDNILIDESTGVSRLTDFGLVRFEDAGSRLTAVGQVMGTPQWMSPEQCEAKAVDGRSDLYSAGLCFYYMLAGENPFNAPSMAQVFVNQLQRAAPSLREQVPALSEPLERFVLILLAKPPGRRFPDAQAALAALSQVERGENPVRPSASQRTEPVAEDLEQAAEQAVREHVPRRNMEPNPRRNAAHAHEASSAASQNAASQGAVGGKKPRKRAASRLKEPSAAPTRSPRRLAPPSGVATGAHRHRSRTRSASSHSRDNATKGTRAQRAHPRQQRSRRPHPTAASRHHDSNAASPSALLAGMGLAAGAVLLVLLLLLLSC